MTVTTPSAQALLDLMDAGYGDGGTLEEYEIDLAAAKEPDTSAKGKRCRFRGVDGTNFEGVVEELYDWGERITLDDGTPRQVHYSGIIWIDTLVDSEGTDAPTAGKTT